MRVLIIEDERKAAQELKTLLSGLRPGWSIVGMLPSAAETIGWLNHNKTPDLIFSDIQLADAVCFNIFETVDVKCPIIFCTAYDEYAIKAFETNGIDYLLKPIDKRRLEHSLQKLDSLRSVLNIDFRRLFENTLPAVPKSILVYQKEKIIPVAYSDIAFFYYGQGQVTIRLMDGTAYPLSQGIDEMESSTDPRQFYRANRQFVINRNAIRDIEKFFARKLIVKMTLDAPETIIVSKAKASDFLGWLENAGRFIP
jgi:DNA-binding LytR/AlgR family response regulator